MVVLIVTSRSWEYRSHFKFETTTGLSVAGVGGLAPGNVLLFYVVTGFTGCMLDQTNE